MTRVKICGLTRQQDAELAVELGADALGFVFEPSSPRYVSSRQELSYWLPQVGPYVMRVAVYGPIPYDVNLEGFQAIQGLGAVLVPAAVQKINVVRLKPETTLDDIRQASAGADAILLDAHHEEGFGGTGTKVDWNLASEVVEARFTRVILAGGLTPDNVREAIDRVKPYSVDVSSGVETSPGIKDPAKLRDFIQAAKRA